MTDDNQDTQRPAGGEGWRNWISLTGVIVAVGGFFSFFLLFVLDIFSQHGNPYVGILAYLIAPGFVFLGIGLVVAGWAWSRRRSVREGRRPPPMVVTFDLSSARSRRTMFLFGTGLVVFLLISAMGSYQSYHFTESVTFCGQACHVVMKPEFVTYQNSPHSRVSCAECHIGPGAEWYVKAKISGLHQVVATALDTFPRPIATPIANLRPARETCEQCHWPQKHIGNLDRTYHHFLTDDDNTPYSVRLLLNVGGGDPLQGQVSGIHWHTGVSNKVEYFASDPKRQKIPWVRVTTGEGVVREYRAKDFTGEVPTGEIRTMDCMDCHNRPSHTYQTPNESVDLALALGRLDRGMKGIKREAVAAMTQTNIVDEADGLAKVANYLAEKYPNDPRLKAAIAEVQRLYTNNFFPEMKANWSVYPNNSSHKDWPGCFRCHDNGHKTADGQHTISATGCNTCHVILAEGSPEDLLTLNAKGAEFKHPEEGWEGYLCNDCHTGGN